MVVAKISIVIEEADESEFWLEFIIDDDLHGVNAIVARQEIVDIQGLRGKTIGLSKGTYLEYLLNVVLQKKGLSLKDVIIKDIVGEKAAENFIKRTVDAIVAREPLVTEAIEKGNGRKLFDDSKVPGISPSGIVFHRSFVEKRADDVQKLVNVWHKTTGFIKQNSRKAFEIVAAIYHVSPEEVGGLAKLDRILDLRDNLSAFTYAAGFESLHGSAKRINRFMIRNKTTQGRLDTADFLDSRFIRRLAR